MVPCFLFIALDGVGDLPDAGSFGRVCRPGVIDRQPRGKRAWKRPPGDRFGAGAPDLPSALSCRWGLAPNSCAL